jgi:MFS family permease
MASGGEAACSETAGTSTRDPMAAGNPADPRNGAAVPLARVWTAVLLGYLALGATLQELPRYVPERFHAGPFAVGLAVGLAFAGTAAGRPFAGRAGDGGRPRATAMTGALLTAAGAAGSLLAPDFGMLLVARLVMGLGEAALFSGALPWVLAGAQPSRIGRVAGWFGLSMWCGLSAGPLLAVVAAHVAGSAAVWSLVIALPLVSVAILASTPRAVISSRPMRPLAVRTLLPRGAGRAGILIGMASFGYGTLTALLVLFLGTKGLGAGGPYGLAVFSGAFLITRAAGSPLVDRYGGLPVARVVLLTETAGLALLASAHTEAAALGAAAVAGTGLGLIYPAATKLTLRQAAPTAAGAAVGAMTSFWDLGILVAGPVGGLIATSYGFRAAFWTAALMPVIAVALSALRRLLAGSPPPERLAASVQKPVRLNGASGCASMALARFSAPGTSSRMSPARASGPGAVPPR